MTGASGGRQLLLLMTLWWRQVRRRPTRLGAAPRPSGVPTFLLLALVGITYMAGLVWSVVTISVREDETRFALHMAGVLLAALGLGIAKGAATLHVRGMRNDAFLEPLPLHLIARLGLQIADGAYIAPLSVVVPAAAQIALGRPVVFAALLGALTYVAVFVVGQALVAWARALGPLSTARFASYLGMGLLLLGTAGAFTPATPLLGEVRGPPAQLARWWLGSGPAVAALFAGSLTLLMAAYQAVLAAERWGFDRLDPQRPAPKASKRRQDRGALEWQMALRHGGRPALVMNAVLGVLLAWALLRLRKLPTSNYLYVAGFITYLGGIQTIAQAGRSARGDLLARPFLVGLPLSPHQVLDGKSRALRRLLVPVLALLCMVGAATARAGELGLTCRVALTMAALYVVVDGAVSVAFMSEGIGVPGIGGGQATSVFSTQLLMMPLLTTALAPDVWAATTAFLAVVAVTAESRRAARMSVRWLDDPSDDAERETTVWRALLAASAFFALQALSARLLVVIDLPAGYKLAAAFALSGLVLALLTWRNTARFPAPRFVPSRAWFWIAGPTAGAASGLIALALARVIPRTLGSDPPTFAPRERVALFVTMTIVAPLIEEYFFRGWLQRAIHADLLPRHKRWAFAIGACAFALAHVGGYGVPQLVLGLVAGALYAFGGGLGPAILAHAMHNGTVVLLSP